MVSHVSKIIDGTQSLPTKTQKRNARVCCGNGNQCLRKYKTSQRRNVFSPKKSGRFKKHNLRVSGGGTHPFSDWKLQNITTKDRYDIIVNDMGDVARSNLIFGLHVHVGVPNREEGIRIQNIARYFYRTFMLSTSSPFWEGRNTGFKSFRQKIFAKFPRTGIPSHFNSWADFEQYVNILIKTGTIDNAKKILVGS